MAKLVPCGVRKAIATGSKHPEYHGLRVSSDYPLLTAGYMQRLSFPPVFNLFKYLFVGYIHIRSLFQSNI